MQRMGLYCTATADDISIRPSIASVVGQRLICGIRTDLTVLILNSPQNCEATMQEQEPQIHLCLDSHAYFVAGVIVVILHNKSQLD
jgi:hypothetical protein